EDRKLRWEGWVDMDLPPACGPCACGPARCVPPTGVTTHASACSGEGPPSVVEADEVLHAACTVPPQPIPDGAFASVTYGPPTLAPCAPAPTPEPPPVGGTFARACQAGQAKDMPPPGWSFCVERMADGTCPSGFT